MQPPDVDEPKAEYGEVSGKFKDVNKKGAMSGSHQSSLTGGDLNSKQRDQGEHQELIKLVNCHKT